MGSVRVLINNSLLVLSRCIGDRVQLENEMTSNTVIHHQKRVCWILDVWQQADTSVHTMIVTKTITECGQPIYDTSLT